MSPQDKLLEGDGSVGNVALAITVIESVGAFLLDFFLVMLFTCYLLMGTPTTLTHLPPCCPSLLHCTSYRYIVSKLVLSLLLLLLIAVGLIASFGCSCVGNGD